MGKINRNKRKSVYNKFGGRCGYTGHLLPDNWEIEHMTPINHSIWKANKDFQVKNGVWVDHANDIENLIPTFHQINIVKGNKTLEEFRERLKYLHKKISERIVSNGNLYPVHQMELEVAFLFGITDNNPFSGSFYFETANY